MEENPRAYALQTIYKKIYKQLWSLNLPSKVKVTIWRLSWNYLPTKVNLQHRKLAANTSCPRCGQRAETMNHVFRECPVTVDIWRALSFQNILTNQCEDFIQWLTWAVEQLNPRQGQIFYCTLWAVWGDRNKRVHEGKVSNGKDTASFINSYIKELTDFENRDLKKGKEIRKWMYPQSEFVKINFDGAYKETQNRSASGIVVRDSEGHVLLSYSKIHDGVSSPFAAEAIACWTAVKIGIDKGWQSLIFEGDSLAIIKRCNTKEQDRLMVGTYIYDIQKKIFGLNNISFQHTSRSANNLAHILATATLRSGEEVYLEMGVPEYVEDQERQDRMREPN
ncbi:hypothetical protein Gotri_025232 [Gossypium trilobum]|uniref:RNase H type-1 domain-containing protein n=1 Tax=Gossypium trilobum TaxID=34281 RepID=A0A7J9FVR2_9ROSI|nr:hypothetical protein [Gossypium trilobum]